MELLSGLAAPSNSGRILGILSISACLIVSLSKPSSENPTQQKSYLILARGLKNASLPCWFLKTLS